MRIVAGKAKGRRLKVPVGRDVRPTTDRVREALFSTLGPRVIDAQVLDLFAGSGALGLEALSRGASGAVFVERSRKTAGFVRANIAAAGFDGVSQLFMRDAMAALRSLRGSGKRFDLVFLDPPYDTDLLGQALEVLLEGGLLNPRATIVAEHRRAKIIECPEDLRQIVRKQYGDTVLTLFEYEEVRV